MSNKQEYVYSNIYVRENNTPIVLKNDGIYANNSKVATHITNPLLWESNWNSAAVLTKDKKIYVGTHYNYSLIDFFSDKKPVWCTSGGDADGNHGVITADDKLYVWGTNSCGELGLGHKNRISSPILATIPNNEKPFMFLVSDSNSGLLTTTGNVYVCGTDQYWINNSYGTVLTTFTKINGITNVTHFTILDSHYTRSGGYLYMVTRDGSLYVVGSASHQVPSKVPNISGAKYVFGRDSDAGRIICVCEDGSSYFVEGKNVTKTNVSNCLSGGTYNNYAYLVIGDKDGKIYSGNSATSMNLNSSFSNNSSKPIIAVDGLAVEFPSDITGVYDKSPNGLKYNYRVRFVQTDQITETSNVVNYETTRILSVLRKILIINILYKYMRTLNF